MTVLYSIVWLGTIEAKNILRNDSTNTRSLMTTFLFGGPERAKKEKQRIGKNTAAVAVKIGGWLFVFHLSHSIGDQSFVFASFADIRPSINLTLFRLFLLPPHRTTRCVPTTSSRRGEHSYNTISYSRLTAIFMLSAAEIGS